jgi:hypothetical protein
MNDPIAMVTPLIMSHPYHTKHDVNAENVVTVVSHNPDCSVVSRNMAIDLDLCLPLMKLQHKDMGIPVIMRIPGY